MNGVNVKVLVAHGLGNARALMEKVKAGELKDYHFIEIMALSRRMYRRRRPADTDGYRGPAEAH